MDKGLFDNSDGTVVIRDGGVEPENSRAGGFFTIGGGNGFSGGFGGSSRKRAKKRARARAAENAKRQAADQAQAEAARQAAHRQQVSQQADAWQRRKATVDEHFAARHQALPRTLQAEVHAASGRLSYDGPGIDLPTFLTSKSISEVEGLIARKLAELQQYAGRANTLGEADVASQLAQLPNQEAMQLLRQSLERGYVERHEAQLLAESLRQLNERLTALRTSLARQQAGIEHEKQRNAKVLHKQRLDDAWRREKISEAHTLSVTATAMSPTGMFLGRGGALVVAGGELQTLLGRLGSIASAGPGAPVAAAIVALTYSSPLGNGELTQDQRRLRASGVGVPADLIGLKSGQDLQAIADVGGTAQVDYRLKIEEVHGATTVIAAGTGETIPAGIPVRNAVLDPVTNTYRVEGDRLTDTHLSFTAPTDAAASNAAPGGSQAGLISLAPEPMLIPAGADLRFDDCIVCVPGHQPFYFSFEIPPVGHGMAHGVGEPTDSRWWRSVAQPQGVPIPSQVAVNLTGREFASFAAFERELWLAIAEENRQVRQFQGFNLSNIQRGIAPYAPDHSWAGSRGRYEVRYPADQFRSTDPFDMDRIRIHLPNSSQGVFALAEVAAPPWIALAAPVALEIARALAQPTQGNRTWTPLVAPGSELLGPTVLPEEPALPEIYPGGTTDATQPQIETLPGLEEGDIGPRLPGYGDGTELPSPDLVFAEPVEPLETGGYNELRKRSVKDGLDIDHIVSRKAIELYLRREYPGMKRDVISQIVMGAPCIAIPSEVHRKFSETYGGRNTADKQLQDSLDLRSAVDSNFNALKGGLLKHGFTEAEIELSRDKLHSLHRELRWYK